MDSLTAPYLPNSKRQLARAKLSDKNCTCGKKLGLSEAFSKHHCVVQTSKNINIDRIETVFNEQYQQNILQKRAQGMKQYYDGVTDGSKKTLNVFPAVFNFDSRIKEYNTVVLEQLEEMKKQLGRGDAKEFEYTQNLIKDLQYQAHGDKFPGVVIHSVIDSSVELSNDTKKELKKHFTEIDFYDKDEIEKLVYQYELESIKKFWEKIRPQSAESDVFTRLITLLFNQRGLMLHSLKLDVFLQIFTDEARRFRKANKLSFKLTSLEEKIADALNLTQKELNKTAHDVIFELHASNQKPKYSSTDISIAINSLREWHENLKTKAKNKFKANTTYCETDIEDAVKLSKFEHSATYPGEIDFFTILPDLQLLMQVEVKCDLSYDLHTSSTSQKKKNRNLKSAAKQMTMYSDHIAEVHGSVLSDNWDYLKVAAILPNVKNQEDLCNHCRLFLLTDDNMTQENMSVWWNQLGLSDSVDASVFTKQHCYQEYLHLFNRLVNLSAIAVHANANYDGWKEIQGANPRHISAGMTQASGPRSTNLLLKQVLERPHDAYKVLYFSPEQQALLSTDEINHVIFFCDFGAGKSLLCKEKATQKVEEEEKAKAAGDKIIADPVFYISLVGVDHRGFVEEDEYIFDIYTKLYDFVGTDVKVKSAQDMWEYYDQHHKKRRYQRNKIDIYTLIKFFIKNNPNGHFIIDECPMIGEDLGVRRVNYNEESLRRAQNFLSSCQAHWETYHKVVWVSFQSNAFADMAGVDDVFKAKFEEMKNDLFRLGWLLPILSVNMRNQRNISSVTVQGGGHGGEKHYGHKELKYASSQWALQLKYHHKNQTEMTQIQESIKKLSCSSTVVGEVPTLVNVYHKEWLPKKLQVLKYAVDLMSRKNDKNIVILHENSIDSDEIDSELIKISNETIVTYPSTKNKQQGRSDIKSFVENGSHILVTKNKYFNGAEASNVIFIAHSDIGVRSSFMRAAENLIIVNIFNGYNSDYRFNGFKNDNTFGDRKMIFDQNESDYEFKGLIDNMCINKPV